jgi:glutamyl-tRNA reductase
VSEVYIIANRQRFTVYVVHEDLSPLTHFFTEQHHLKGYVQFYYNSGEAVAHLMATASGLLSPVKGEGRILSDIIRSYEWACDCGCIGVTLDNTLSKAIETGRLVRTQTGIDQFCASAVETGIELLYNRFENLHTKNFLIVGTGKMARLALESLTGEGISNIAITGHDTARVAALAKKFRIRTIAIDSLREYFFLADVIIGVSHEEIRREFFLEGKPAAKTGERNRIILDLGVPPNFDPETVEMWAGESYNLDDLRRLQPSPLESFGGLEAAWRMVVKASNDFAHVLQLLHHSPVLTAYLSRQFNQKNADLKIKPRRTLRSMLMFKKPDNIMGTASVKDLVNARAHVNNYLPDNGLDVVRHVTTLKKFRFFLTEN